MKKIFALLLAFACLFAVVSCNDDNTGDNGDTGNNGGNTGDGGSQNVDYGIMDETVGAKFYEIIGMFPSSKPMRAEAVATEIVGSTKAENTSVMIIGEIDGGKDVTQYYGKYQRLADVGNDLHVVAPSEEYKWYVEGKGISTDKGVTYTEGENFAPTGSVIKLKLEAKMVVEATYDAAKSEITLKISKDYATEVVSAYLKEGQEIVSDLTIRIKVAGGRVTELGISYTIPERATSSEGVNVPETSVTIEAKYSYDLQEITLG